MLLPFQGVWFLQFIYPGRCPGLWDIWLSANYIETSVKTLSKNGVYCICITDIARQVHTPAMWRKMFFHYIAGVFFVRVLLYRVLSLSSFVAWVLLQQVVGRYGLVGYGEAVSGVVAVGLMVPPCLCQELENLRNSSNFEIIKK